MTFDAQILAQPVGNSERAQKHHRQQQAARERAACQSEAQQRRPRQATEASTSDELTETEAGVAVDDEGVTTSAASAPARAREDAGLAAEGGAPAGSTSGAKRARQEDELAGTKGANKRGKNKNDKYSSKRPK